MPKTTKSLWLLACLTALIAALTFSSVASAGSSQLSLIQDDRELLGETGEDPGQAMTEIKNLGVDIIRTNVIYGKIYRTPTDRAKPAGFVTSDPNSPQYDWSKTDRLVSLAEAAGLQLQMTITTPGPFFSTVSPNSCRRAPCTVAPKLSEFADFVAAVAKRYRGKVDLYSLGNEFNLGKTWLTPRFKRSKGKRYDYAAATYRKLYRAGQKAIAANDPARRNRVLFGETAAIASPLTFIRNALCIDGKGKALKGTIAKLQGCSGKVAKLNTLGFAIHPYNQGGNGTPRQRTRSRTALPLAHLPRLTKLLSQAAKRKRIAGRRGVYVTEFGYQTNPPDRISNVSPTEQAQYINESDRLFFSASSVKTVAQYELTDVPQADQFNTGLRFVRGARKPSYDAYRLPLVVTRRSSRSVEVYGEVRPHRLIAGGPVARVTVQSASGGGAFTTVTSKLTNRRGFIRFNITRGGASKARWRLVWQNPDTGEIITSRVAKAGKKLTFYKN